MKKFITGIAILSMLSLFSCTKVVYTHDEVLSHYTNKQEVMKKFGPPTEKKISDTTEDWLYRYDSYNTITQHTIEQYHNTQTATVIDFSNYKRYLVFNFDQKGNVIRCDFQGVDLTVKKKDTAGTILLITAGAAIVLGSSIYITHHALDGYSPSFSSN